MSSCLPCCQQPGRFAAEAFGATEHEAQGLDDVCKSLLEIAGCRDRKEALVRKQVSPISNLYSRKIRCAAMRKS